MATKRVKVTLQVWHIVNTADYLDEEAEVIEDGDQPELSLNDAVAKFEGDLDDDPSDFLELWYERGDFEVVSVS